MTDREMNILISDNDLKTEDDVAELYSYGYLSRAQADYILQVGFGFSACDVAMILGEM